MPTGEFNFLSAGLTCLVNSPQDANAWAEFFQRAWPFVLVQCHAFLGRSTAPGRGRRYTQMVFWRLSRTP